MSGAAISLLLSEGPEDVPITFACHARTGHEHMCSLEYSCLLCSVRSAEALYMMGERQTVKESMTLWEKAVELDPCNERYRSSYQNVCLVWEAEYNR